MLPNKMLTQDCWTMKLWRCWRTRST